MKLLFVISLLFQTSSFAYEQQPVYGELHVFDEKRRVDFSTIDRDNLVTDSCINGEGRFLFINRNPSDSRAGRITIERLGTFALLQIESQHENGSFCDLNRFFSGAVRMVYFDHIARKLLYVVYNKFYMKGPSVYAEIIIEGHSFDLYLPEHPSRL